MMGIGWSVVEARPTVCFAVVMQVALLGLFGWNLRHGVEARRWSGAVLVGLYAAAALVTSALTGGVAGVLPVLGFSLLVAVPLCVAMKHDSVARPLFFTHRLVFFLLGAWLMGRWFRDAFPPSAELARLLLFIPWVLTLALVASQLIYGLLVETADLQPLTRRTYLRPTHALPPRVEAPFPRVTVHIPCHAEPPEVVIATLDAVARQDYPAFDVIVVDNNTADPALWRPVEAHCARLGERFRFVHVESLPGAKAGALNLALRLTPPGTRLVALLDADYVCEPDFLSRLVGFFDDPSIDYVQTPHDYRDWEDRWFLRACYWEERQGNLLQLPALSEWGFTILIGTTCLIRRHALESVGGWSEKSLTEDSELAFRLSARGGQGLFLKQTLGRGLLPQSFRELQKQRFRWWTGPIQQFQMHWRELLPGRSQRMRATQRRAWTFHGLDLVSALMTQLLGMVSMLGVVKLVVDRQPVAVPLGLLVLAGMDAVTRWVRLWLRARMVRCSFRDMLSSAVLIAALEQTRRRAVTAAFFSKEPLAWERTDKFQPAHERWRAALAATRVELMWGLGLLGLGGLSLAQTDLSRPDLFLLGGVGMLSEAFRLLCAPYVALRASAELGRKRQPAALSPARLEAAAPATAAACRTAVESSPAASPPP
ncbi:MULTISPECIES: glycosyltransferase [unclassified Corallococcus]|uniref:glycosyltransferase n=1 Tax=unclassified Corallococcus TaxID=2685029 RepID=UPI001A90A6EE|nr:MULTISPECIES: glycosyltransferase [unclassified Corallococcus]MBN9682915.1 glycosyltransferase [Corallococcus sp. NCSPR001]WAS85550.1 glycosyltransferase [Corallococcus sp. NCRR]